MNRVSFAALSAVFLSFGTAASAAPVQIAYSDIVVATTEDFQSSSVEGGQSASFNGFTLTTPLYLRAGTRQILCETDFDGCAFDVFSSQGNRIFDLFLPGTTAFGLDLFSPSSSQTYQVTVTGVSGTSTFTLAGSGLYAFSDTSGLTSVVFNNLGFGVGFGNYSFDDVITGTTTVVPLPATLPLLAAGFLALGALRSRHRYDA